MKYMHPKSWAVLCNNPKYFCANVRLGNKGKRFDHGELVELDCRLPDDGKFYYKYTGGWYMVVNNELSQATR